MLRDLLTVHPLTVETHEAGLALAERYNLSTYDAMIAASAIEAGCDTLWSRDIRHGMVLEEGLRIVNPFRVAIRTDTRSRAMAGIHPLQTPNQDPTAKIHLDNI